MNQKQWQEEIERRIDSFVEGLQKDGVPLGAFNVLFQVAAEEVGGKPDHTVSSGASKGIRGVPLYATLGAIKRQIDQLLDEHPAAALPFLMGIMQDGKGCPHNEEEAKPDPAPESQPKALPPSLADLLDNALKEGKKPKADR